MGETSGGLAATIASNGPSGSTQVYGNGSNNTITHYYGGATNTPKRKTVNKANKSKGNTK